MIEGNGGDRQGGGRKGQGIQREKETMGEGATGDQGGKGDERRGKG